MKALQMAVMSQICPVYGCCASVLGKHLGLNISCVMVLRERWNRSST